jgi:glycosyltransferase involved in cell wall biosynthesis
VKILYLNPLGALGGAERSLLDVMASIRAAEPDWPLQLIAGSEGPLVAHARELGVSAAVLRYGQALATSGDSAAGDGGAERRRVGFLRLLARVVRSLPAVSSYTAKLKQSIAAAAPDLIHANGFKMHILAARACPPEIPLVWHIHDYPSARRIMPRLLRMHARRCSAVVANSHSVAADVRATLGARVKVSAVYNAVDLERFAPDGPAADLDRLARMNAAPAGTIRVGLVATMAKWKGHALFLNAVARLPRDLAVRAYVIGGPIYETLGSQHSIAELRALAGALGIADRVGFTGFVADTAAATRALDVVVHASTEPEPFGLVIAEAMSCGKPVVVSAGGGAGEFVRDGVNALAFPGNDPDHLAQRITRLVTSRELRENLGREGRATAERTFARSRLALELIEVYRSATGGAESARAESLLHGWAAAHPARADHAGIARP